MNKAELVAKVAEAADISEMSAQRCVEAMLQSISDSLVSGESVTLAGFGTFSTRERAARQGLNPKTREPVAIPARRQPIFKAGKRLKDELN